MTRDELLQQVEDLSALLSAIDRLAPGRVDAELFTFLERLPQCPVTADLLLAGLRGQKVADPPARHRAV